MKILTIFNDGQSVQKPDELIEDLKREHQVEIVSLADKDLSYDDIIDKIEKCDKVISW